MDEPLWRIGNDPRYSRGQPLASIDYSAIDFRSIRYRMNFFSDGFKGGQRLGISGTPRLLWWHKDPRVNCLFLVRAPVARDDLAAMLERLAPREIQRFPLSCKFRKTRFEIVNVTRRVACCLTETANFEVEGKVTQIRRLVLDAGKARRWRVFRLEDHFGEVIISDSVRRQLMDVPVVGALFEPVETI